jgi:hypothetical protein
MRRLMFFAGIACVALACIGASLPFPEIQPETRIKAATLPITWPLALHWKPSGTSGNRLTLGNETGYTYIHQPCNSIKGRKTSEIIAASRHLPTDATVTVTRVSVYQAFLSTRLKTAARSSSPTSFIYKDTTNSWPHLSR